MQAFPNTSPVFGGQRTSSNEKLKRKRARLGPEECAYGRPREERVMATLKSFDLDATTAGTNGAISFTEGGSAMLLAPNASVSSSGNFGGQTLTISGLLAEDEIGFAS